jgi:hypothetical protein
VFISYSSADAVFADLVKLKLNAAGINVWMDHDRLDAGEECNDIYAILLKGTWTYKSILRVSFYC